MRKINPASVLTDFGRIVNDLEAFHQRVSGVLLSKKDVSTFSESTALSLAVAWEGFVSDILVAYINRDCSTYAVHLQSAFKSEFSGKQDVIYHSFGRLEFPRHMDRTTVLALVDRRDQNITFSTAREMQDAARRWLVPADHARFDSLNSGDRAIIDLLISLRNHLAHGSQGSLDRMNDAMAMNALHGTGLNRGARSIYNVGSYLKAVHHGRTRLAILVSKVRGVAAKL